MEILAITIASLITSVGVTRAMIPLLGRKGVLDLPNDRSSHTQPTPRGGGIAIVLGLVVGSGLWWLISSEPVGAGFAFAVLLIAAVGIVDDYSGGLSASLRLLIHMAAGLLLISTTGGFTRLPLPTPLDIPLGALAVPVTLLWIVGITNIYNFLDGIDGYAALIGVISGLGIALCGVDARLMPVGFTLAGACAGFLVFNWHPARIFMGDVGSGVLGFFIAAIPLQLGSPEKVGDATFIIAMCLWFFLTDGVFTILRRLHNREKVWVAHRSHIYQLLTDTGLRHDQVAVRVGLVTAALTLSGIGAVQSGMEGAKWGVLVLGGMCFIGYWLYMREKLKKSYIPAATEGRIENANVWWRFLFKRRFQFLLDLVLLAGVFWLVYLMRFDFRIPPAFVDRALIQLPFIVSLQFLSLLACGVYKFIWRYVGLAEVKVFIKAALFASVPIVTLRYGLPDRLDDLRVPVSVIVIDTALAFGGILGLRVARRYLYESYEKKVSRKASPKIGKKPVLLIGAGKAGLLAVRELLGRGDTEVDIKGFVDDDLSKQGAILSGVKVLGTSDDLPRLVAEHQIDHVVISIVQAPRKEFKRILEVCERIPVKVRVIPGLFEILQGRVNVSRIRDLEIEDLLGRAPVRLDESELERFLTDRVVMVTGAGGSIGSELVRQVARLSPASILLVERSEPALFNIDRELRAIFPNLSILPMVADVCDEARMRYVYSTYRPHVVLHSAAHKHVPMMELNPTEAVKNNSLATRLVGELAGEYGVKTFVLISTDKAVRPTSIMGASKRVAELIIQWLNGRYETHYVAVRFGNVIGSTGSVIPLFREQIAKGGPVTVTHPDMVRYFMTIPEASQLVLQAGAMGEGGEIFVLDMGEPVSILELAKDTIMLSGFKPYEEIEIAFTGLRPGEKLFEELEMTGEKVAKTRHPKIFIGKISAHPAGEVSRAIDRLQTLSSNGHHHELCAFLGELLPESQLSINRPRVDGPYTSSDEASHLVATPGG